LGTRRIYWNQKYFEGGLTMKWKRQSLTVAIVSILWTSPIFAKPTISQDVQNSLYEKGSARVIVGLALKEQWQPEGKISPANAQNQRAHIKNAQNDFVKTLNQALQKDGKPTIEASWEAKYIPYLAMEIDSITLSYVAQNDVATTVHLDVPDVPTQDNSLSLIEADIAINKGYTGNGQTIVMLDSGVDNSHPDFSGKMSLYGACYSSNYEFDYATTVCPNGSIAQETEGAGVNCDTSIKGCDHGTHVAGIAVRAAPDVEIVSVQVFSNIIGEVGSYHSDQLKGLEYVYDLYQEGVSISAVNMSLTGLFKNYDDTHKCDTDHKSRKDIVDTLKSVGIATIASAGNSGIKGKLTAPACISSVISVGATDLSGEEIANYSNSSPFLDLVAPGTGIESALPGGKRGPKDGTSMATAYVTAAVAILKTVNPEATVEEILAVLKETGQLVDDVPMISIANALDGMQSDVDTEICNSVNEISQAQCETLLSFYMNTGGDSWSDNTGWNETNTPCDWKGITCNNGEITNLSLPNNNLKGRLPSLNVLKELTFLRLDNNQLTGQMPSFNGLKNLQTLWLYFNQLTGSIPNLSGLEQLTSLSLHHNQLTGFLPDWLNYLENLQQLHLQNNQFAGAFPELNLANLEELRLSNNQLSGSMPALDALASLDSLWVYGNSQLCKDSDYGQWTAIIDEFPICVDIALLTPANDSSAMPLSGQTLTWEPVPDAESYQFLISSQADFADFTDLGDNSYCDSTCLMEQISTPDYTAMDLSENTPYFWKVRANNAMKWSEVWSFTTVSAPTGDCSVVSDGLVACYPFNRNANDESGNGNHAIINGTTLTNDRFGNNESAYGFDGISNYIKIWSTDEMNQKVNTTEGAISVWFSPDINTRYESSFVYQYDSGANDRLYLDTTVHDWLTPGGKPNNLLVGIGDNISTHNGLFSKSEISDGDGSWYHTVVVWQADGTVKLYFNGKLDNSSAFNNPGFIFKGKESFYLGRSLDLNVRLFKGLIDDLRVYNRALAESEIQTLHNLGQPNESGLTVTKTGEGRGTVKTKLNGTIDWNINCTPSCQEANYDYVPDSEVYLRAYPEKGFVFSGWGGSCSGTDKNITVTMDSAETCTAQFDLDSSKVMHLLTVNTVGDGTVAGKDGLINCGEDCTASYQPGKTVTLTATPDANTLFMGWAGACSGQTKLVRVTMDAAKSCTATFNAYNPNETYPLTCNKIGDGRGVCRGKVVGEDWTLECMSDCTSVTENYTSGHNISLRVRALDGFIFREWGGDCSGTETSVIVPMDKAKNCTAQFDLDPNETWYKLEVYTVGTGIGTVNNSGSLDCGDNCTADWYREGESITLRTTSTPLSEFSGWSGNCEGNNSAKLTMTQDMTCTAEFKSRLEIGAEDMIDAFFEKATLQNEQPIATQYPRTAENEKRLKEAFWYSLMIAIPEADVHYLNGKWPKQLIDINKTAELQENLDHTESITIKPKKYIEIVVNLQNNSGTDENLGILLYYGDLSDVDGGGGRDDINVGFFSRWAFIWWW
jgi:subtilisin